MSRCIAYLEDRRICGAPASVLDEQRGGMVCAGHDPLNAMMSAEEETAYARGWLAGHRGARREAPAPAVLKVRESGEWLNGYDDATRGVIDARKFLGRHFRGTP
jgi:hypothetical protein